MSHPTYLNFALTRGAPWRRVTRSVEPLAVVGLLGLAMAVRWPNLLLSPQSPAVDGTVLSALELAEGRSFPLVDQAPYLGALFIYLLAGVYKLVGPSIESTMLLPCVLGALTAVPTYLLGRQAGGRVVGLLAGAFMATSAAHTVISSHVPLSHSLTPLLSTISLWLLLRFTARGAGLDLALAGLTTGLALQTHPTAAPLLFGATGAALLQRRDRLRTCWPAVALGLLLLGYGNLLVYGVQSRLVVVADIQGKQARYLDADVDHGEDPEQGVYGRNLEQLSLSLVRLASGALLEREGAGEYLGDPAILPYALLGASGLSCAQRGAGRVLIMAILPAILLPPALSGKYKPILDGRYLMPIVPLLYVGLGLALAWAIRRPWLRGLRPAATAVQMVLALLLIGSPLLQLREFYRDSQEDGLSNARYLQTIGELQSERIPNERVLLDARLRDVKTTGGGNAGSSFAWMLAVSQVPVGVFNAEADPEALVGHLAILQRDSAGRLSARLSLVPLDGQRLRSGKDQPSFRAYRAATSIAGAPADGPERGVTSRRPAGPGFSPRMPG